MRTYRVFLFVVMWFLGHNLFAQVYLKESYVWTFGGKYVFQGTPFPLPPLQMSFHTSPPTVTVLPNSVFQMYEGGTSICDTSGKLILYTTGSLAFDRLHDFIPNNGFMGNSQQSASQGSMIVRQPGSYTKYYIFTTPDIPSNFLTDGFRYHIVDLSLNGGLGAVESKNHLLLQEGTERVCAVLHENQTDVWIMTKEHETNRFFAWRLTPTGLDTVPVISSLGISHNGNNNNTARGIMKFSPNGKKMAITATSNVSGVYSMVQLFDFNPGTGQLSNVAQKSFGIGAGFNAYGVEFSPASTKLYVVDRNGAQTDSTPSILWQFDLCKKINQSILDSGMVIDTIKSNLGSMQLGPDRKIYIARDNRPWLGIINYPDSLGLACEFVGNGVALPNNGSLSLPNFNTSAFSSIPEISISALNVCEGDSTQLIPSDYICNTINKWVWDFGDTASGAFNTDSVEYPKHVFSKGGIYRVKLIVYDGNDSDTIFGDIKILPKVIPTALGPDFVCRGNNAVYKFKAPDADYTYQWLGSAGVVVLNPSNIDSVTARFNALGDSVFVKLTLKNTLDCPDVLLTQYVRVTENIIERPIGDTIICRDKLEGNIYKAQFDTPNTSYEWLITGGKIVGDSTGANISVNWDGNATAYAVRIRSKANPTWPDTCFTQSPLLNIEVVDVPNPPTVTGEINVCEDLELPYKAIHTNEVGNSFIWKVTDGLVTTNPKLDTVRIKWGKALAYTINVNEVSKYGCVSKPGILELLPTCWEIPNVITVNNDAYNQYFEIKNGHVYSPDVVVYNRWGQKVYSQTNYKNDWNGKGLSQGIYFYHVTMNFPEGKRTFKGSLHLIKD